MLLIGLNETFGRAVLRIDKHDALWIAAGRVNCKEDDRLFQDLRLRVHRSAFEKEALSRAELGMIPFLDEERVHVCPSYDELIPARRFLAVVSPNR